MKKRGLLTLFIVVVMVFLTGCFGSGQEGEEDFVIGIIPSLNQGEMQEAVTRLAAVLERELDRPVDVSVYADYNGVVEAMNYGQIDMAYYGPLTYVIVNKQSGAQAIITQLVDGEPWYYSYIIAPLDAPFDNIEEMLAKSQDITFAFADPNSTSGSLVPALMLKEKGVFRGPNDHDFKDVQYSGSHDVTAAAVEQGNVDAGAIDSAIYDMLVRNGKADADKIKVIWQSEGLFQYPWAVKSGTSQETITALQEAFLSIDDPVILDAFAASGFTIAEDADYLPIREAAEADGRI
ncbi:phosphate/phosphite/phosphonate ABC transporter substrate-binding protein [Dethiobacter alkaliphilus]|uniref:phosphate/phosphite/phosphonate ABC transporter substrate-binding protein n=1 Tax=Dethiobacter alkaliphilus TaxID=427926 RepID=UPI0022278BD7|nr:phosphate/phosphite/phosphonate ABC transporter substrate-binding protein [Dethiobacter alkaliphilus]MCW3491269.1 phosphate/phosphite/phosphonate ABC transporter substrate-binding protein [Dethiobacter alkaliphilus]